jgi:hypothetical protein
MINDASVVIGGGNWGIKEADVLGYKLINDEYYARDIDFANSTAAGTYTDSTGVIRKAPYNLASWSEQFDNAAWVKTGTTITPNTTTAPNGTLTADTMSIADSNSRIVQVTSLGAGTYTISAYVKVLSTTTAGTIRFAPVVDGSNTNSFFTPTSEWARYTQTFTATTGVTAIALRGAPGGFVGDVAIWGAQLVEGTEALPYFPTTTRLNVPRIDYRNADGSLSTVGRLLLEPQRTNSLFYSEQFDNAYFAKGNSSILANAAISPSGNQDADKLVPDTSNSIHSVNKSSQSIVGGIYSVFAKADGYDWILLTSHSSSSPPTRGAFFNVNNGTVGTTGAGVNANIQNYGNGWYRCSISEGNSPSSIWTVIATNADNVITFTGNGTDGVLIWGGQNEQGTYPTTYIPTTTAAVTRNADLATRSGVESWIGQTQGTMFAEINLSNLSLPKAVIGTSDGTLNNRIILSFATSTSFTATVRVGGSNLDFGITIPTIPATGGNYKVALSYAANNYMVAINGTLYTPTSPASVPSANTILLGQNGGGANIPLDGIAQAAIFPTRLTNSQLQSLTTL